SPRRAGRARAADRASDGAFGRRKRPALGRDALRVEIDRPASLPELDAHEMTTIGQQRLRAIERLRVGGAGEFLDIGDAPAGVEEVSAVPAHDANSFSHRGRACSLSQSYG